MNVKDFAQIPHGTRRRDPHGLSRSSGNGTLLPTVLGLGCAAVVLGVLWLAYTFA